jgi:hypothetical protein
MLSNPTAARRSQAPAGAQLFVAGEKSPGKYLIQQTVKTGEGARTMAMGHHGPQNLSTSAAEFETATDGRRVAAWYVPDRGCSMRPAR